VAHHFERIYDVYFCENAGKPALAAYERLLDALGGNGKACLMAEDSVRNLCPARTLGMTTVLVDPPPGTDVDGVDYVIDRVSDIARIVCQVEES
jgi:putative hydrolase of the HAD superfamily